MPRILSLSTLFPNAHTPRFGTFVARQMETLAATPDWDVTLINPVGVPPIAAGRYKPIAKAAVDGVEGGVQVYRPRFTLFPKFGGRFNPAMIARAALPLARKLHADQPFDLLDAQFFYPDGPAIAQIADALQLPFSIKARGADISHWGAVPYARNAMLEAATSAYGLLAVSEALRLDMGDLGMPVETITVHYTGLDHTLFKPLNRAECREWMAENHAMQLAENEKLVTSVGALIPRKGQTLLIQALVELPDVHLALVGRGDDRTALASEARRLGVARRVHMLGSLDHTELPIVLSASNAMALNSASEGLANAWVEALACGTPIVITDVGGARELVKSDSAGRIVDYDPDNEPSVFARAIREVLYADYSQYDVAANAAHFSWEANAAALADYYRGLIGG
ncbi:glycosyltransferase [Aurantiacibacter sediminis]|uniref:Glycosyltransferase n=1 Tax=Aurantiacibacter sediminis TaxID=2793064 RepID=A0ABS0N564_9SPHN|nr:glycosyltransferase [Aurantiacibacter sediminis]MBH5322939.1 glycosyltransferase [Aurantiacibacter sediminis]